MKQVLFVLGLLVVTSTWAQDGQKLVVEGKTWLVHSVGPAPDCSVMVTQTLLGDTVLGAVTCMKLYEKSEGTDWGLPINEPYRYIGALYEEGQKVYYMPTDKAEFELLYDFGLQTGSVFSTYGDGAEFKMTGKDEVVQGGVTYARQYMSADALTVFKWVEGVGSETGLTHNGANGMMSGSSSYLISCTWPDGRSYVTDYGKDYLVGLPGKFVVEGKKWLIHSVGPFPDCSVIETQVLIGDTVLGGVACKKLYEKREGKEFGKIVNTPYRYYGALYEEGKKVYYMPNGGTEFELLYDFGLQTGSVFSTYGDGAEFKMTGKDEVAQGGVTYARQYMSADALTVFKWVEGVGSETGLTHNGANGMMSGSSSYLISCTWPDGRTYVTDYGKEYVNSLSRDFVVYGKTWNCAKVDANGTELYGFDYYLKGDTVIAGKDCQKMYCCNRNNAGGTDYVAALTEESGKVWCFYPGETEETLLYDFGLSKGDHLPESLKAVDEVYYVDTLNLSGRHFRTFVAAPYLGKEVEINGKMVTFNYDYDKNVIWMEGIGGGNLPLRPLDWKETGTGEVLKSCSLYGVTLAEYGDFKKYETLIMKREVPMLADGVEQVKAQERKHLPIYDLLGRKITNPMKGNIYIRGGKKYIQK